MDRIYIAFDFGKKNIGVAIGQSVTYTAYPLSTIKLHNNILNWNSIKNIFEEWEPNEIIVGLPLNMNGTEQTLTINARKFANKIHKHFNIKVKMHDERLSTVEARTRLFENGGFQALKRKNIDSNSAVIILESYLQMKFSFTLK